MKHIASRAARWFGLVLVGLVVLVILFLLFSWVGSSIPRGEPFAANPQSPVPIQVETNGFHTQLVLPIAHPAKDWRETFPSANEWVQGYPPTHISIGFGEREVFLNTPTLGDLDLFTALRVTVFGGEGLIRVSNLVNPSQNEFRREIVLSGVQYADLVAAIENDLPNLEDKGYRAFEYGSYDDDAYYTADRGYTVASTCNQWTSDRLADANIRTGWWTPFSGGVMKWVPPYSTDLSVR